MKSAILISLVASAAAFAPVSQKSVASTSSLAAFEDELGVQPPLGFFDPLGLLNNASQERFDQLRYTELKHGRVSMLAVAGFLANYGGLRLPGNIDFSGTTFESIPSGLSALNAIPKGGFVQLVAFVFVLEFIMRDNSGTGKFSLDPVSVAIISTSSLFSLETNLLL